MIDDKFAWRLVLYLVAVVLAHYIVYREWLIDGPHDFLLVCVMGFYLTPSTFTERRTELHSKVRVQSRPEASFGR